MRHGQRAPLRTSLPPSPTLPSWRRRSVVKGRSDIYTRGHCHCTFRRKLHGFMVKYRDSEHSLSPFLSLSRVPFPLYVTFVRFLSLSVSVARVSPVRSLLLPLFCFISPRASLPPAPFGLSPSFFPAAPSFPSLAGIALSFGRTRIMSA